ncbi:MAG: hypothetical protein KDI13_06325 [Alphaproteobacteria bacterium]|nr:hypothetical protein [Alphaproteobacteria bacterium]
MFSTIKPVYGTERPRETENTDARLALYRRAADDRRNGRKNKEKSGQDLFGEDNASVSTESLLAFLEEFLEQRFGQKPSNEKYAPNIPAQSDIYMTPLASRPIGSNRAIKAAQAYAHAAQTVQKTSENTYTAAAPDHEGPKDMQTIMALINDLKILAKSGVETIDITRGNSFLNSLAQSIQQARTTNNETPH